MKIEDDLEYERKEIINLWDNIEHDVLKDLANIWLDKDKLAKLEAEVERLESKVLQILQILPDLKRHSIQEYKAKVEHLVRLIHHLEPKEYWVQSIQSDLDAISKTTENVEELIRSRRALRKQNALKTIQASSRQIISTIGVPVQTVEFKHRRYKNLIVLCIGEITTMGKLSKEFEEATREDLKTIDNLENIIFKRAEAHLKQLDPQLFEAYIDKTDVKLAELAKLRSTRGWLLAQSAGDIIDNFLRREKENSQEGIRLHDLQDELKYYGHYRTEDDESVNKIVELLKKLEKQKIVAYIIQIEVLKKYQNQGLTKAVFDVAVWRIEYGKEPLEITYAIIMDSNRNRFLVIDIFKNMDMKKFHVPEEIGPFGREGYTLMVRIKN